MKKLVIGLVSHIVQNYNLGCSALAISNIKLMDEVFIEHQIEASYIVLLAESKENIQLDEYSSLAGYTTNSYSYRTYPRLKQILKKPSRLTKSTVFDDCDFIINLCGGDGYTDIYGMIRLIAESVVAFGAAKKGKPVIYAPQTIGPFNTFMGKIIAHYILSRLDKIFVRDISSFKCCKKMKLQDKTTQVIDVAFALPYEKRQFESNKFKVGVNVSGLLYNGGYNRDNYFHLLFSYKDFIEKLLNKLSKNEQLEVHLIPHVNTKTVEVDDDYRVCEALQKKFFNCILAPRFTSPVDAKGYISGMDLFTGARMHSTIGAFSSGVPVIPVAYSRKFNGLYDTLKYPYYIDAKVTVTCEDAIRQFEEYMGKVEQLRENVETSSRIYQEELVVYKQELALLLK